MRLLFALFVLGIASCAAAQQASMPSDEKATLTIHTGTRLVVLDVGVFDSRGRPVHGLKPDSFRIEENKSPQSIRHFDAHSAVDPLIAGPKLPALSPGSFTNYTPVPPSGPLNVLLIDALNTPRNDQTYLREQLVKYVEHAPPGQNVAVFGLNSGLFLLQGFTSDSETLKRAIASKGAVRGSNLLDDPEGTGVDKQKASEIMADLGQGVENLVARLQQFEADSDQQRLQLRTQQTLDALDAMARYLGNFPGHKNLVWFSGSFPLNLLPDPNLANVFSSMQMNDEAVRRTSRLLAEAQVAVYPVDARGVVQQPGFDAATSGRRYSMSPTNLGKDIVAFDTREANVHSTMDKLAEETGGHAFYGSNDLAQSVTQAINDGADYYTLAYSPPGEPRGELRNVHVALHGWLAGAGYQLRYRHSYFARERAAQQTTDAASTSQEPADTAYMRIVQSFGSPLPQDILFQVHLASRPAAAPDTAAVSVDFAALPGDVVFAAQPNGNRTATVSFKVFIYDAQGQLLNTVAKALRYNLPPDAYKKLMAAGVGMHLEVNVPAHKRSNLRLVIEDVAANKFGAVEIPIEAVPHTAP